MQNSKGRARTRLTSVTNAVRLLRAFTNDAPELGISELAKRLGLVKSTVHRLASTLIEAKLLEQNPETMKYRLGLALFELGTLVAAQMDLSKQSGPHLEQLMEQTGETVHLAVLEGLETLYVNKIESRHTIRMYSRVGRRGPLYCTGVGKALLAFQDEAQIQTVIAAGLTPRTGNTITDTRRFLQHLAEIRKRGYAVDDEEIELGLRCIAAPIRDHTGAVIASVSVAGPVQRMTRERLNAYAPLVLAAADAISERLGYRKSLAPIVPGVVRRSVTHG